MITKKFETEEEWLEARRGKISGTKAGNLILKRGEGKKKGYYEILAERVAIPRDQENVMDRGKRLEDLAIERFVEETGKKVDNDLQIWYHDKFPDIIVSPDGTIGKKEAVESKSLSSASHCEAFLTSKIPNEYNEQKIQYFVVNPLLETLYWVFFDPSMPKDFFYFTIHRQELEKEIAEQLAMEEMVLKDLAEDEKKLTF